MADVVELPTARRARRAVVTSGARRTARADLPVAASATPRLGRWPTLDVDAWGRDAWLLDALRPLGKLRWNVTVGGEQHVPRDGPALLVANARRFSLSSLYASEALSRSTGRVVRFVGRPDIAPVGPLMRRLGALLDRPDEVANALRNGEVVMISASATSHPLHVGVIRHELLTGAVLLDAPVIPVATMSNAVGRSARVEVGARMRRRRQRRGPLAEVEMADDLRRQLQRHLDELGYPAGVGPFDWLGDR